MWSEPNPPWSLFLGGALDMFTYRKFFCNLIGHSEVATCSRYHLNTDRTQPPLRRHPCKNMQGRASNHMSAREKDDSDWVMFILLLHWGRRPDTTSECLIRSHANFLNVNIFRAPPKNSDQGGVWFGPHIILTMILALVSDKSTGCP